jgi:hypothetical protein
MYTLSLGGRDLVVSRHGRHRVEYAVTSDERMEERRRDMQQDQGKEHESKVEVRVPEQRTVPQLMAVPTAILDLTGSRTSLR